jgi:tetratricopeptide (TPR) repeat protein
LVALGARPIEGEGMASGDVVNTAARLQAAAPANGILVGEATYRATRDSIEYCEAEPVLAKGKSTPIPVWEAVAARSRFGEDVEHRPRTKLVGRERELGLLVDALARCRRELTPQLMTLVGVPGIGKSRLVGELFQVVDRDSELIWWRQGRSLSYGESLSYWALGEIVKAQAGILDTDPLEEAEAKLDAMVSDVVPAEDKPRWITEHLRPLVGLSVETGGGDRRSEAFAAWRKLLEALAERHPLVLVFEDLHWADDGLLDFVDHLADWATGVPLLIVGTARPELLDRRPDWGGGKRNAATVSIPTLTRDETAELVGSLLDQMLLPAELQSRVLVLAEGNPLYAEEYVRMLQDRGFLFREGRTWRLAEDRDVPLPETVHGMIAARLDALAPAEKELLQNAAVIGKVFWPASLGFVGDLGRDELLHGLERKEFIRRERRSAVAGESQYAFLHALVRDVAYGQIPRATRARKHRRAAEWIESLASDRSEDRAEMLAHHYVEAIELARAAGIDTDELRDPAIGALGEAVDRATALNGWAAVGKLARAALALLPNDDARRPIFLLAAGNAGFIRGDPERDDLLEASARFEAQGEFEQAAEAELVLMRVVWHQGDRESHDRHLARAVALVEARSPTRTRAHVFAERARAAFILGDAHRGLALADEALPRAEEIGDDELISHVLNTRGMARVNLGDEAGLDDLRRSAAFAEAANAANATHNAYNNLANMLWRLGELDAASATLESARAFDERVGNTGGLRWLEGETMSSHYLRGEWPQALEIANDVIAAAARSPHYHEVPARIMRSDILLRRGEAEVALADTERALELARLARDAQVVGPALLARAHAVVATGQQVEAEPLLDEVLREHDLAVQWLVNLPFVVVAVGREPDLLRELDRSGAPDTPWASAARALAAGDPAAAATTYAQIGARAAEAQARLLHATTLVDAGRRADANAELNRALAWFRSVGAVVFTRLGEALLAASA